MDKEKLRQILVDELDEIKRHTVAIEKAINRLGESDEPLKDITNSLLSIRINAFTASDAISVYNGIT